MAAAQWETAIQAVKAAIDADYRHIDAAAVYGNEISVGRGIKESGIEREKLFVTSKVWNMQRGYDQTIAAFKKTLSDLWLDNLALYLIHWPASASRFSDWEQINLDTWRAMTELYQASRIIAIGVYSVAARPSVINSEIRPFEICHQYHKHNDSHVLSKENRS